MLFTSLLLALLAPSLTRAQQADTIRALRAELEQLRASYQARIDALEQKLRAAQAETPTGVSPAPRAPTPAPTVAPTVAPSLVAVTAFRSQLRIAAGRRCARFMRIWAATSETTTAGAADCRY